MPRTAFFSRMQHCPLHRRRLQRFPPLNLAPKRCRLHCHHPFFIPMTWILIWFPWRSVCWVIAKLGKPAFWLVLNLICKWLELIILLINLILIVIIFFFIFFYLWFAGEICRRWKRAARAREERGKSNGQDFGCQRGTYIVLYLGSTR